MPTTRGLRQLEIVAHLGDGDPAHHPRGLYVCDVRAADLPYVLARLPMRDAAGAVREWRYLLSADADGPGTVVTETELVRGSVWPVLGLDIPGDSTITEAVTYAVRRMARALPVTELVPRWVGDDLRMPPAEVLESAGYMITGSSSETEALAHWRELGEIATRPGAENLALNLGFAAASPYLAALSTVETQSVCVAGIGPERRGKTTNAYAAAAWYGSPTVLDPVMSESAIAVGDSLAELGVLPFFRDEVHGASWSAADWHMFFMRTLNGAGRRRSSSDGSGTVRRTRQWWGVQFLTGNIDPRFGETGGITARVLVLSGQHLPDADTSRRVKQLIALSYGWPFKWWLSSHDSPAAFAQKKARALADIYAIAGPQKYSAETISEALSLAIGGAEIIEEMFQVSGIRDAAIRGALRVLETLAGTLADSPTGFGSRLMHDVSNRVQMHPAMWPTRTEYEAMRSPSANHLDPNFVQRLTEVQGFRWEHEGQAVVSMLRGVLEAMADGRTYPRAEALTDLRAAGVLVTGGDRRGNQHAVKICGRVERFYTFRIDVPADPDEVTQGASEGPTGAGNDTGNDTGNDKPYCADLRGNDGNDGNDAFGECTPVGKGEPAAVPGVEAAAGMAQITRAAGYRIAVPAPADGHPGCERCGRYLVTSRRVGQGGTCLRPDCASTAAAGGAMEVERPQEAPQRPAATPKAYRRADPTGAWQKARQDVLEGRSPQLVEILAGPCAPRRRVKGDDGRTRMQAPYWRPELPAVIDLTHITAGFNWSRPFNGPTVCFDRSGAWVSAASAVKIAHGALIHTGEMDIGTAPLPAGSYLVRVHRWEENDVMPSPLGEPQHDVEWVPEATATLLRELAEAGRWGSGELEILDSYTAEPVRLDEAGWATGINELRGWAIDTFGREVDGKESPEYKAVKSAMGQAFSVMVGDPRPGAARVFKSSVGRPDITQAVQAHSTATLWRRADAVRQLAGDGLGPVALRNVDELVIPEAAVSAVTGPANDRAKIKALRIDQTGKKLGTFKVKPGKGE